MDTTKAIEQTEQLKQEANEIDDVSRYTHVFKKPLTFEGKTFTELSFDFDSITGKDDIAIEREVMKKGVTVVIAELTPEYLTAFAVRACTNRDADGFRVVNYGTFEAMRAKDRRAIANRVRSFLLASDFEEETEGDGSVNSVLF